MGLSKEQVEKHISSVEKRLGSARERAHHGYEFARLCMEVGKHQEALRYLTDYLSVQEKDFRGHKLMGQVCEKDGKTDKAIVHYNRSLQLKPYQREVATSVATLYCKMESPPVQALKMCLERIKPFISAHSLVLALNEKIFSLEGGGEGDSVAEQQLALCKDDIATHIRLVNHYSDSGVEEKALVHCLSQRNKRPFTKNKDWLNCVVQIAEQRYVSVKRASPSNHVAQCHLLISVLDHLSLLFHTPGASGSLMASVLLKYDKVLYGALQALRLQQPRVLPVQRVALRELCGQFYLLMASYMYWGHRFRSSLGGKQTLKHSQVGDLCLLASLSFPPPNLDSIPLTRGMEERRELEAWHTQACKRLCVVSRQLILVSKQKGDVYLGGLAKIVERQGGKLAIIKAVFTENEDLRGTEIQFASTSIVYNIRSSYLAAESEHLLAQEATLKLPSEEEVQLCDREYILNSGSDLSPILWLCLCLRATDSSCPMFTWLSDLFPKLKMVQMSSSVRTTAVDTLCLCDVEAMLVLSANSLQSSLTSPPSNPPSLPESLLYHLPVTIASMLEGADMMKYRQWWSCVHQWLSQLSSVDAADVKQTLCEGLGHVRGCRPLRLSVSQLTSLAKHFQQKAEKLVEARDSTEVKEESSTLVVEALLKRSGHYWEIIVDILADRDSYRDTPKYRKPQSQTPKREDEGTIQLTPVDSDKVSLLNEARMALADAAAYRSDFTQALGLYSRVKTAQAAWNQAQIHLLLAEPSSQDESSDHHHLEKGAETLELALTRLKKGDRELREKIEEKREELKQLLSERQRRKEIAVSLHYDSSPDSSPPVPRKSSTPTTRGKHLSPFSLEKKSPIELLNESVRMEIREKNSLIVSMSDQLKYLQAEVSALKLHISPVATRQPHSAYLHQASPQAMGGATPHHQYMSPSGVQFYQPHPSLASSFGSPLVHQQSPMRVGIPQQPVQAHRLSPQPHLTPLPPHLSPSMNPALSIPSTQFVVSGHAQHPGTGRPQMMPSVAGGGLRPGMQVAPSVIPQTTMFHAGHAVQGEHPVVAGGPGGSQRLGVFEQQQHLLQVKQQQQGPVMMTPRFTDMQLLEHQQRQQQQQQMQQLQIQQQQQQQQQMQQLQIQQQQQLQQQIQQRQLLLQQQQQQQQLRMISPRPPAPPSSVPVATSSLPSHLDPASTGFVLKSGTFLPASTQPTHGLPVSATSGLLPPGSVLKSFPGTSPPTAPSSSTSEAQRTGEGESADLGPGLFGTSVSESPFTSSLPLSCGFQFSMKPSLSPSPAKLDGGTSSASPKVGETLKSLLQSSSHSSVVTTTVPASLSSTITASALSTTSQSSLAALPPFSFHATTTTATSFTEAAVVSSGLDFGHLAAGATAVDDLGEGETEADRDAPYDACPDFKPIVSLPKLEDISTGEEDEKVLFSNHAKLYRFYSGDNTWKERGIGEMKILEHKMSGKTRVLMRREQVLKLCCNHYITEEMILTRMRGDRQVAWFTHCDFAEGVAEAETFAVKFKKAAVTEEFRNVFEACVSKCKGKDSPKKESSSPAPLTEMFAAPVGSWECASCLVQNQPTAEMCVACSTARPESREDTTTIQTTSIPTTILTATATTSDSLAARFSAPVGSWECDSCLVRNQSTTDECVACGASKPGSSDKPPPAQGGTLPIKFGLPTSSMGSTSTFNFGAPGQMSDLKLDNLSFGTPVSIGTSKGTSSGGFKMGGLTLGALGTELAGEESASTSEPLSLFGAGSHSLFGGHSSAADSYGTEVKSLFGATTESSQGKTEQKISFKLGDTSTGTQPASESGLFGMQAETEGTDSGFKFSLPSLTAAASGGKGRGKLDQGEEGILKLEPFGLKETKPEAKPFSGFGSNEDKPGSDVASIFKSSLPATSDSGGVKLFQFSVPSPQSSPVPPSPEQQNTSHSSAHEPDIHFEPIVTLPDSVEVSSGEENEEALFTDRSKLFRFDSKLNQWKERGVGEIKVLVNRDAGKARVLMRRDQVLKICCNHLITRDMSLTPMQNSQKAWTWLTLCDFADETGKPEKLAVRFKSPAIADAFKKAFEDAQECGDRETPTGDSAQKTAVPHGELANGEHDEHNGEDHEDGEGEEDGSTPAITSHEVADLKPDDSHEGATPPQKSQLSLAFPTTSQIRFGARLKITPHLSSVVTRQESSPETNDEHQSSPSRTPSPVEERPTQLQAESLTAQSYNEDDQDDVIFISVDLPSEDKIKLAEEYMLPPSFFNYETQPPCPGCRGCVDLLTGPCEPSSFEPETDEQGSAKEEDVGVEKEESKSGFKHFSGSHGESSFSSLAASTGGSEDVLWGQKSSGFSGFRGAGTQLFAAKPPSLEEDENPEAEANMNFKPIVMLTAVETKTGEEEEECLFSHRAKLYRFNDGQWKERGVGDIKILRNRVTERSRVVMRRDQILKICCNHLITPEMSLQKNISSEKARTWKTLSDFAEETAKEEIFSVRFKHVEMAKKFEEVFKACQAVSDQSITGDSKSPSGPVTPPHPPHQEEQLQGDDAHSTVPDEASSLTCMSLKEVMLTSAASSETEEETGIDGELPPPQEPASSPVDKAVPEKKSADTTPRLRLPLTPPPPVGSGSVLSSAGSALRLPLTEPQGMMGGNPLPEEAGNNAKTEESETEQPQEPQTQAPPLFGSVSFADLAKDESGSESESPIPEEGGSTHVKAEESETTEQPLEPQAQAPPLFDSSASVSSDLAKEVMGGEPIPEEERSTHEAEESETTEKPLEPQAQAPPLFDSSTSLSFANLTKDGSASGFLGFQKTEGFQFGGVGGKIFSSGAAEDQEHPEKEVDIHFKPVVTLPETVNIKSWDDDADTLFCRRCKLYRFDDERQWKERGVGELKIMKHRVTGKVKLIMRRDQIFKLCCNHSLTSDMKLTVMAHSEKACSWFTSADLSEEEARPEKLSAKFKSAKFMNEFREAFERCQTELVASDEVDENRESEGKVGESVSMQSSEGRKEEQEGERNSDGKAEHQTDDI